MKSGRSRAGSIALAAITTALTSAPAVYTQQVAGLLRTGTRHREAGSR